MELRLIAFTGEATDGNVICAKMDGGGVRWEKSAALWLPFLLLSVSAPSTAGSYRMKQHQRCLG